ncbi:MAG: anthranilate synthase component I [Clostridiales bacterium]|nr:anthranilate synthase component I [Clostridiales bacterium]
MEFFPSQQEVLEIAQKASETGYRCVPVSTEILSDVRTPIEVLRILKGESDHVYMLESCGDSEKWGRYTFLGMEPTLEVTCLDGIVSVKDKDGNTKSEMTNDPDKILRGILEENKSPRFDCLPPFAGGLVGYFSYDYIKYAEPTLNLNAKDEEYFKDCDLMLFDKVIAFDNFRQKIILIANIKLDDPMRGYEEAKADLAKIAALIRYGKPAAEKTGRLKSDITPLFTKEQYCDMVEKAKEHIRQGDIFQIVLSNRLSADYEGSMLGVYRILRTINPSPYMFYFSGTDVEVAGASPETLVKLEDGVLHTFPLAGTRPRGKTDEEDKALEAELLQDEKELAEHNMLVDLGRNDLGKISEFGSVVVESFHDILRYSHVMHIGSTVKGIIREDLGAFDAVDAVLPAGTLSGAPKIRACQIINDLEDNKRGIYGGAVGYIDFTGNLDTCIGIRLAYKKNNKIFIRSGAGIVADSVPEKEYQECLNKAASVVKAIREAEEEV